MDPNLAGEFPARYTDLVHIVTITCLAPITCLYSTVTVETCKSLHTLQYCYWILICWHEFPARYTHLVHIVTITGAKILMHPPHCPYRGNASALGASRGVHNKSNPFSKCWFILYFATDDVSSKVFYKPIRVMLYLSWMHRTLFLY